MRTTQAEEVTLFPSNSPIVEIRIHADSGAFNSTHGNIEQAVMGALKSVGYIDPRMNLVHYEKVDGGIAKVVVHQRIIDAGTTPVIGAGENTKDMQGRIERALRKIIGAQPAVRFTRDATPAPRQSYGEMRPYYKRPALGRNSAVNGHQAVARM